MNSSFSTALPSLQIAWDSTSLGLLKECPRKYYLSMLAAGDTSGYAPRAESVHLTFGILYHGALERYDHAKFAGASHDDATVEAVHWALCATWNKTKNRPWLSDDKNKNRYTLIRTIVWYLEHFRNDPVKTIRLANGKPAVELSFRWQPGLTFSTGDEAILCGHLDRLGEFQGEIKILDRKTTKYTIDNEYFKKYSPDNQFSNYMLAGTVVYQLPVTGLIVDAAQIAVTFSRFERGQVSRTEAQLEEWLRDTKHYLRLAEFYAKSNYWPMNDKSCGNYGGCPFREICAKPPAQREQWLAAGFARRTWDPLQVRGDI